jgi:uncharacterized membrane-anchored protein
MLRLPVDHPERLALAGEVHARPPEPIDTPARATHLALLVDAAERERERLHLTELCERHGVTAPLPGATHFRAVIGALRLKWERHGEFSSYTFFADGADGVDFAAPAASALPVGWLAEIPGMTMAALHGTVLRLGPDAPVPDSQTLTDIFGGHAVIGSEVAEGAGLAFTDFQVHPDGYGRVLLLDRRLTRNQAGRTMQRLFEIEAYRMMALLALPIARRQSPRLQVIERSLAALTDGIGSADHDAQRDEALLHDLTRLAAEIESGLSASQFRFGACRAYADLVTARIAELRERRLPGLQTIDEFMTRRFRPAVATCQTVSQRLHDLSERISQASGLLRTRVEIARERQNQDLLASMDRRARLQLRLQQTVEGLSVAAIAYYVAGLIGYGAKALEAAGLPLDPNLATGLSVPFVALAVYLALRRARRRLHRDTDD